MRLSPFGLALSLALCASGGPLAAQNSWRDLSFVSEPYSQEGSPNLFPSIGADLRGWDAEGNVRVVQVDGAACLALGAGGEPGRVMPGADTRPGTLYIARLEYAFTDDAGPNEEGVGPSIGGWLTPRDDKTGAVPVDCAPYGTGWHPYEAHLFTPSRNESVTLTLAFEGGAGAALIRRVELVRADIPSGAGLRLIQGKDRVWAEAPRHPEPDPPAEATLFAREDPDRLFWYSRPRVTETGLPLTLAGAPGETLVAAVGCFSADDEAKVTVTATPPTGDAGALGPDTVEVLATRFHPRRTDYYGRGNTWHWVADSYHSSDGGAPAEAGTTAVFHIRVHIPDGAGSGVYKSALTASVGDEALSLPVELTIYPFALAEPEATWCLYSDFGRWREMTDDQVLRELTDMRAHGITSLMVPTSGEVLWQNGRAAGYRFDDAVGRAMRLIGEAGLPGPYLLQLERLPRTLCDDMGIARDVLERSPAEWPAALGDAFEAALQAIDQAFRAEGWGEPVFVGVDEPGYWKEGSPEVFEWQYSRAAQAGIPTYCTSSYLPSDPIGRYLTYHCYGGWLGGRERARMRVTQTRAAGQSPWYYAAGCYPGQVGNLVRNRYVSGFVYAASGVDGQAFWTFQRPRGENAFDDFVGADVGQPCITYPDPDRSGENLDTPHWEGMRQGYTDLRYVETLRRAIDGAPTGAARDRAEARLGEIMEGLPWSVGALEAGAVTTETLDAWRREIADLILSLR